MKTSKKAAKKAASKPKTATRPVAAKLAKKSAPAKAPSGSKKPTVWNLRLYVAGQTPRSLTAFANLKQLCEEHLQGRHTIEVVDLLKQPHLAVSEHIVALPTLVRKLPAPIKRVIGDLSNFEKVRISLDLQNSFPTT